MILHLRSVSRFLNVSKGSLQTTQIFFYNGQMAKFHSFTPQCLKPLSPNVPHICDFWSFHGQISACVKCTKAQTSASSQTDCPKDITPVHIAEINNAACRGPRWQTSERKRSGLRGFPFSGGAVRVHRTYPDRT